MNQDEYQAEQSTQAVREGFDRAFAEAEGQEHLIELLRLALRMERVAHDVTRRTMALTLDASEGKSAVIRSLVAILDHHGIEHPPLREKMTVVTH